jgi:hypothetical protein
MTGVLAAFDSKHALQSALAPLRDAGFGDLETYTPQPMEDGQSILPSMVLLFGILGAVASFALLTYGDVWAYKLDIGGRPPFSWPSFIPIAFENGILAAVLAGVFGYFVINRLPRLYDPIDHSPSLRRAMRDLYCVAVRTTETDRARAVLTPFAPVQIEELPT